MIKRQSKSINNLKQWRFGSRGSHDSRDSRDSVDSCRSDMGVFPSYSTKKKHEQPSAPPTITLQHTLGSNLAKSALKPEGGDVTLKLEDDTDVTEGAFSDGVSLGAHGKQTAEERPIRPEDMAFMIRDTSSGVVYDIRNPSNVVKLNSNLSTIESGSDQVAWQEWWKTKRELNARLLLAAESCDLESVKGLLDAETHGDRIADVNTRNVDSYTALHFAAREAAVGVAKLLVSSGANLNAQTRTLRTPLHLACLRGHRQIIEMLVGAGADVDLLDREGNTAVHLLAEFAWDDALAFLLKSKPNLAINNKRKQTAYSLASNPMIKKLLSIPDSPEAVAEPKDLCHTIDQQPLPALDVVDYETVPQVADPQKQPSFVLAAKMAVNPAMERLKEVAIQNIDSPSESAEEDHKLIISISVETEDGVRKRSDPIRGVNMMGPEGFVPMQLIGKGLHGEVYAVKDRATGLIYAMKVLEKSDLCSVNLYKCTASAEDPSIVHYPLHPFIAELEYAFKLGSHYFFIEKYCPGYDFRSP